MSVLDELASGLQTRRLGTITRRVQDVGHPDATPLSVFLDAGVVPRSDRADNHNQLGSDLARYQLVQPGDLVFNRLRTWQGGFGASRHRGIVSPAYIVARPAHADARYLDYLLHSAPYLAELTRISKWMPPSQFDVLWADLRNVEVPWRPLEEQQRIADFLDDRVARINKIITARGRQVAGLSHVLADHVEHVLDAMPHRTRASRLVRVLPGYAFPSDDYSSNEADVPLLRGVNVAVGRLRWEDVSYWPASRSDEVAAFRLEPGDVVMGMDRPWIGGGLRIAQVGPDDGRPLLLQRVAKLWSTTLTSRYVFWAYQSRRFRDEVEAGLTGLSVPHLSGDQILSYVIPFGSTDLQEAACATLDAYADAAHSSARALSHSVSALQEYKQSLITAAVTGELDVTTASSGIPG